MPISGHGDPEIMSVVGAHRQTDLTGRRVLGRFDSCFRDHGTNKISSHHLVA